MEKFPKYVCMYVCMYRFAWKLKYRSVEILFVSFIFAIPLTDKYKEEQE
jgi:hypothetical protein